MPALLSAGTTSEAVSEPEKRVNKGGSGGDDCPPNLKILLVDDNLIFCRLFQRFAKTKTMLAGDAVDNLFTIGREGCYRTGEEFV